MNINNTSSNESKQKSNLFRFSSKLKIHSDILSPLKITSPSNQPQHRKMLSSNLCPISLTEYDNISTESPSRKNLQEKVEFILTQVNEEKLKEQKFKTKHKLFQVNPKPKQKDPNFYSNDKRVHLKHSLLNNSKNISNKISFLSDRLKKLLSPTQNSKQNKSYTTSSKMLHSYHNKTHNNRSFAFLNKASKLDKSTQINKVVIRDFGFSRLDEINYSKRNYSLTEDFLIRRQGIAEKKAALIAMTFEQLKRSESTLAETDFGCSLEEALLNGGGDVFRRITEAEYKLTKAKHEEEWKRKIEKNAKSYAKLFRRMSMKEYSNLEHGKAMFDEPIVNFQNLERSVKVKYINEHKTDMDNEEKVSMVKFRKNRNEMNEEIIASYKRIGAPNFIKRKFRGTTIMKFREVNGDYMGIPV